MTSLLHDVENQLGTTTAKVVETLTDTLAAKAHRNRLRQLFYDSKNLFKDLGIAIPPNLRNIEVAMGWPAKAVDELAARLRMEAFTLPGGGVEDWGIPELVRDNRLEVDLPQAITQSFIESCAFILTAQGNADRGEPEVMISMHSATDATGKWDRGRRALSSGLVVMDRDENGPTRYLFLTPVAAAEFVLDARTQTWRAYPQRHNLGRVPLEVLPFKPTLHRPFGQSRISRPVMSFTNSAMRTVVRAEVGAEFYSVPQRYLLGADEESFVGADGTRKSTWDLMIGRLLVMPDDEDAADPRLSRVEVGQFPQVSMQPHGDQFEFWATQFAGETGLPLSSLGYLRDNPESAEAQDGAWSALEDVARGCKAVFKPALRRAMWSAVQLRDGLAEVPPELRALDSWWPRAERSQAAITDAIVKQVQTNILPADSDVTLERLGYDEATIQRVKADRAASAVQSDMALLAGAIGRQTA